MNASEADVELGPVDHLVVEFPAGRITAEGFRGLLDLVDRRLICVLDLEFVMRDDDGGIRMLEVADVSSDPEFAVLAGACSGLLDDEDLRTVADSLQPGTVGAVLIFEHLWVSPMLAGLRASGGRVVSENRVPVEDLLEALDRIEQSAGVTSP